MDDKEIVDLVEELKKLVKQWTYSADFKGFNRDISHTVNSVFDEVRKQWQSKPNESKQKAKAADPYKAKVPTKIKINPIGKVAGTLYMVFGSIGLGIAGSGVLVLLIVTSFLQGLQGILGPICLGLSALCVLFGGMLYKGRGLHKRLKRLKNYMALVQGKHSCSMKELAEYTGYKQKYLIKDLKKMLKCGMVPKAYIDDEEKYLILDKDAYKSYLEEEARQKQQEQQQEATEKERANEYTNVSPLMKEGLSYVKVLKDVRQAIAGTPLSSKLLHVEKIVLNILAFLEKNPKQSTDMQKFMDYYLPTTIKLVNAYHEFEMVGVQGDNIRHAKTEIEETLDTITKAFECFLNELYETATFDATTDAEVLQAMLAREGWTEKDFK